MLFTYLTIGTLLSSANAQDKSSQDQHIEMHASTEFAQIHPGDSGLLAITLIIDEDWHTYWPGVSDSGFGINLEITPPVSVTLDEPIWPTPARHLMPGEILDHIYEGTTTIIVPFTLDDDAKPSDSIRFEINADYLVCEQICLPGNAQAETSIEIIQSASTKSPTESAAEIRSIYTHRPKTFDPKSQDVRVQWITDAAAIMFRDATKIEFFPDTNCTVLAEPIAGGFTNSNRLIINFNERENKVLSGRIRSHERNGPVDYDINITPTD